MPDFSNVRKGDRVWSSRKGWGTVDRHDSTVYPLHVVFDMSRGGRFLYDGKHSAADVYPELHWDEIKYKEPEPPKKREAWVDFFTDPIGNVDVIEGSGAHGGAHAVLYASKEEALQCREGRLYYIDSPVKITWTERR